MRPWNSAIILSCAASRSSSAAAGRGVVAAASYEVRRFGVHSAMPVREALRRCRMRSGPSAHRHYAAVSQQIFAIFHEFTPLVQGLSLDEAFLDVTASNGARQRGHIAREIKRRMRERTELTASVGVAPNKLVAKIASDLRKPDGLVVVREDEIRELLDPLPIRKLFGLGEKRHPRSRRSASIRSASCGSQRVAVAAGLRPLHRGLQQRAAGIDDRPVIPDADEKQISAEETFETDVADPARLQAEILRLADKACARLRARELSAAASP